MDNLYHNKSTACKSGVLRANKMRKQNLLSILSPGILSRASIFKAVRFRSRSVRSATSMTAAPAKRVLRHWCDRTDVPLFLLGVRSVRSRAHSSGPRNAGNSADRQLRQSIPNPSDEEIPSIRKIVASGFGAQSCPTPTIGECVHILAGQLAGRVRLPD